MSELRVVLVSVLATVCASVIMFLFARPRQLSRLVRLRSATTAAASEPGSSDANRTPRLDLLAQ
jgi:hypothetical protein